jgi:O-antigen ligase/polysaccharide polymerase Wzy-like membrane protein
VYLPHPRVPARPGASRRVPARRGRATGGAAEQARIVARVRQRLRSEGIVLLPAIPVVGLLVWWAAHGGGYAPTTWEPSALLVLGLLVATVAGLGPARLRLSRPAAIALAALAAYTAWSYCSILWAAAPGDALDGSNRTLLYLLLFALLALLPWRTWTALTALSAFALGLGAIALVTLVRIGAGGDVTGLFHGGRLSAPTGYENGSAALFTITTILSTALAARRELPVALRGVLLALATAALSAAVLCESRGWLFSLPVVLLLAVAVMPGRLRFLLWLLAPIAGGLLALPALLHVFDRVDALPWNAPADRVARVLSDGAQHATSVALPICAGVLALGLLLALADRRVAVPAGVARGANRAAAALALLAALAGVTGGLFATHGRPDRSIARYWNRSHGYQHTAAGTSRFALVGSNRPDFWRVALHATAAHPLAGLGQDNWGDYYLRHRHASEQPRWTHSLELRLLAHTGIVGFALFAAFLVAALTAALRGRPRAGQLGSAAAAIALLPLAVWLVHGSVDWFWEIPALSGPAFAFLGLAGALMRQFSPAGAADGWGPIPRPIGVFRPILVLGASLAALCAAVALALPYLSERDVAQASKTWRANPSAALTRLRHAADLNPLASRADLTAGVIALELKRPGLAGGRLSAAMRRDPGNWFVSFARGLAASAAGDRRAARADYEHARADDPREPLIAEALRRVDGPRPLTAAEAFVVVERSVRRLTGGT